MATGALAFTNSFEASRRKNYGGMKRYYLYFISQNLVMLSRLVAKKAGKCFLLAGYINDLNKIKVILLRKKRPVNIE